MTKTVHAQPKQPKRSKRLRKKLFLDEFVTFGFELDCEFKADLTEDQVGKFIESEFLEAIEAKGLAFGGGLSSKQLSGFIVSVNRYGSATEEDKAALKVWLSAQANIASFELGEITDANYYY